MEELEIICSFCKQVLEVPPDMRGQVAECPACGKRIRIPCVVITATGRRVIINRSAVHRAETPAR